MKILRRPMFRKGGSANEGIMHGLERRGYDNGGKIEPFNRYTADTLGSPYYDNEVIMENLRRFQELGMGNPYKELAGKAGFDSTWDFMMRPAKHGIFKSIYDAAPIVKKEKAAKEAMETATQLSPYKKHFASDMGIDYKTSPVDKKDVTINGARGYDENSFESRKHNLSERAKYFAGVLNPHARERLTTQSLAAASEAFGKSTGNTWQDVANAITAAAKASGGVQDTYTDAAKLALMEDIELKGIRETAKAKSLYRDYAPSEKIKTVNALVAGGMNKEDAIDKVFGSNNIYANVAEASSKEVGVPESSINIAAGQTYKEDYKGQVESGDWEEFKDTAEDGFYKVGKKIYKVQTVKGKKKITVEADFASTKI